MALTPIVIGNFAYYNWNAPFYLSNQPVSNILTRLPYALHYLW